MRRASQALVIEHSLRATTWSRCVGGKRSAAPYKSSCGRHIRLAGVITHRNVGGAATDVRVK